jgi:hypothetical protein
MAAPLWSDGCTSHRCAAGLRSWEGIRKGVVEITTAKNIRPIDGVLVHRTCIGRSAFWSKTRRFVEARPPGYRVKRSGLEIKVLRSLRRGGFSEPVYEHPVMTSDGVKRPDYSYPDSLAATECESYTYHGGRLVWLGAIERYKLLRRLGWTVIQVTEETLDGGDKEAQFHTDLGAALGMVPLF